MLLQSGREHRTLRSRIERDPSQNRIPRYRDWKINHSSLCSAIMTMMGTAKDSWSVEQIRNGSGAWRTVVAFHTRRSQVLKNHRCCLWNLFRFRRSHLFSLRCAKQRASRSPMSSCLDRRRSSSSLLVWELCSTVRERKKEMVFAT